MIAKAPTMMIRVSSEPVATQRDVAAFEKIIGATLPADYRQFLLEHNGGRPQRTDAQHEDAAFSVQWQGQPWAESRREALLHGFYSLNDKSALAWRIAEEGFIRQRRIPADLIPIGVDVAANQILLGLTGARRGQVFYWAKDFEPIDDYDEPVYENSGFIADSFAEFLAELRPF